MRESGAFPAGRTGYGVPAQTGTMEQNGLSNFQRADDTQIKNHFLLFNWAFESSTKSRHLLLVKIAEHSKAELG